MLPTGATHPGEDMSHPESNTPPPRRWFTRGFQKTKKIGDGSKFQETARKLAPVPDFRFLLPAPVMSGGDRWRCRLLVP